MKTLFLLPACVIGLLFLVAGKEPRDRLIGLVVMAGMLLFLMSGCAPQPAERTETFSESSCQRIPQSEQRTRRVQTTCAMRAGNGYGPHNAFPSTKPCLMWNHRTVTERRVVLTCTAEEWHE
jgi:hypothetical protein